MLAVEEENKRNVVVVEEENNKDVRMSMQGRCGGGKHVCHSKS